jgi:hypothetical protein
LLRPRIIIGVTIPAVILALASLSFIGFGVAFVMSPAEMAGVVGLAAETPSALTEVRAMYGGLEIALGVVLLTMLRGATAQIVGLRVAAFAFGGLALGRLTGLVVDGFWQPFTWLLMAVEILSAGLCVWALRAARIDAVDRPTRVDRSRADSGG